MTRNSTILFLLFSLSCFQVIAQHKFIENKNQWPDQVLFASDIQGGKVYLEEEGLVFDLYDSEIVSKVFGAHTGLQPVPVPEYLDCHSYKVSFLNANSLAAFGEKESNGTYNYFLGNNPSSWASGARAFGAVLYEDIYNGINLRVHSNGNLKYDFIVRSGADPNQIELMYEGAKIKEKDGQLMIQTSLGTVIEKKPFAYQYIGEVLKPVKCEYRVKGNRLDFELGDFNPDYDLVIDPELVFSTYSGSTSDNFGYTATFDSEGHLYSGSTAFGTGYPITLGAYQSSWAGGSGAGTAGTDIALTKFSLDGTGLEYSTYLGGTSDELPHSLITDSDGNLYIFGTTGSSDFPLSDNAYQNEFLGGTSTTLGGIGVSYPNGADMIVARLSSNGESLDGSTYVGGSANDGTNTSIALKYNYADEVRGEIELDDEGNILIGSCTFSEDFPVSSDAYQDIKGEGQDAVIYRLDPFLSVLEYSTFFGSSGDDAFYSINYTNLGIMAGGGSSSNDLPTSAGVIQEDYAGGQADGIIVDFATDFSNLTTMTYYGSNAYDQVYFVERDAEGNPHIYGQTEATGDQFIVNADYGTPNSGMLVSNFNSELESIIWSTVFGSPNNTPNLSPTAFSVDICNRIYLSGWGGVVNSQGSTEGLDVTDDAIKSDTDGSDFYFMVLEGDASDISFGSFYGGNTSAEHVDGGTSRFDRAGKIYQAVCAGCGSNDDFPIFPTNAHSPTNNSQNCNLGVTKIDFDLPLVLAGFEADEVCLPDSTSFTNTSEFNSESNPTYQWVFEDGEFSFDENPSYQFSEPGTYTVTLIITDPEACNLSDTLTQEVEVFPPFVLSVPNEVVSCELDTLNITAETFGTGSFFQWSTDSNFEDIILEGSTDSVLVYAPGELTTIYLFVSNGLCDETREITLAPRPLAELSIPDSTFCNTPSVEISVELINGYEAQDIFWAPEELVIAGQGTETAQIELGSPVNFTAVVTTEYNCLVGPKVTLANYNIELITSPDTLACSNTPIEIGATSNGTAETFLWSSDPEFTDILNPSGDSIITVTPTSVTYYYIQVANNECTLTDSVAVSLLSAGTSITRDQYICAGDTATVIVTNDFPGSELSHTWQPEDLIISGQGTNVIQAVVDEPTTFFVQSSTPEGCIVNNQTDVLVSPLGNLELSASAEPDNINPGMSSELEVEPAIEDYIYQWSPPDFLNTAIGTSPVSTPPATITYIVTATDVGEGGFCSKSDSVTIFVYEFVCGNPSIFVPNSFTPNSDGENDILFVRGNNITDLKFSVFNRWGEKVFETTDQSQGWDGTYEGKLSNPAVFVYQLEVQCADGQEYFQKGNVTLIR